jgi:pyruvate,water dikinase
VDHDSRIWILQARPITTLYPLPDDVPHSEADLRVWFSFNVVQGYFAPITPMGQQAYRVVASGAASLFGVTIPDPIAGPRTIVESGGRLFLDVTPLLRNPIGRELFRRGTAIGETRTSVVVDALAADPRLAPRPGSRFGTLRRIVPALLRSGIPASAIRLLVRPEATRDRYLRELDEIVGSIDLLEESSASARIDAIERLLFEAPPRLLRRLIPMVAAGAISFFAVRRLLGTHATEDEARTLTRGAAHNPTTEMDLALWSLASDVRADAESRSALLERAPADLATEYRRGALPPRLQHSLASFLERYGMRAIGEIDLGVPRWSEDPTHIIGAVANYLRVDDHAHAPDALFARGAREAEATATSLLARVHGPKRAVVGFFLRRVRALIGLREVPKFTIVRLLLSRTRELLRPVGAELAAAGRIAAADDIYFLTIPDARRALGGDDMHALVAERRAAHAREMRRRHIPRVLLSDGTDAEVALVPPAAGGLRGSPASPGSVSGPARVVRSPEGARLEPGEILVAPSTDPGWTPLFLTAGGLVMEMGGMMSHGAVVAREYGIPAVVGVPDATERIATGQRVTVDGSSGAVTIED